MKKLYFIGIKGVAVSALAIIAQGLGFEVQGSDTAEEFITDKALRAAGINYFEGYDPNHLHQEIDLVIVGAAIAKGHPELIEAEKRNVPVWSSSKFQGYLSDRQRTIAIAGTHGKTTTTALTSYLMVSAGTEPTYIIGTGSVAGLPAHAAAGKGEWFITEADDYKRAADDPTPKFLDLAPELAVITSIEHDHPDLYPTLADCIAAFYQFALRLKTNGSLIVNADDPNIDRLRTRLPNHHWISYGLKESADYRIIDHQNMSTGNIRQQFSLFYAGKTLGPFRLSLPGIHNAYNATAAIIVSLRAGLTLEAIKTWLPTFTSVERRFEVLGTWRGNIIVDDYAHHPTAINLTLKAAQASYPNKQIWCCFQAHTYSRTRALLPEFANAFQYADVVLVTDIFGSARETGGIITGQELASAIQAHHPNVSFVPLADLENYLKMNGPSDQVIIVMGAGDIYKTGHRLVESESVESESQE